MFSLAEILHVQKEKRPWDLDNLPTFSSNSIIRQENQ